MGGCIALAEAWALLFVATAAADPAASLAARLEHAGGEELYRAACAACHGDDGAGAARALVAFTEPLPDFTDCRFGEREADADWVAVTYEGGPARGFSELMPAFGGALTLEQTERTVRHLRRFCRERGWPRGELNLPTPLVTEKAFPDDEVLLVTDVALEGRGEVLSVLVLEKRLGARNQLELAVPFVARERDRDGEWVGRLGDIALGVRRVLLASLASGTILAGTMEVSLPTGDPDEGFGGETAFVEPFVSFGQLVPVVGFVQAQAGLAFPLDPDQAEREAFWRAVLGRSFTQGRFGRAWTPMIEVLGEREIVSGAKTLWELVPELQVSLNTRQNILANVGVRVPLNETGERPVRILAYLLWDWFDGGLLDGW